MMGDLLLKNNDDGQGAEEVRAPALAPAALLAD